jgi:23S rRNA pseudoU1915 N3-methylase RlmH
MALREKAVESIIIPLAKEVGLPFNLDELKEYEQEQLKEMNLSEDELDQVAGGRNTTLYRKGTSGGLNACAFVGVGFGQTRKNGKYAICFIIGGSDGPVAG